MSCRFLRLACPGRPRLSHQPTHYTGQDGLDIELGRQGSARRSRRGRRRRFVLEPHHDPDGVAHSSARLGRNWWEGGKKRKANKRCWSIGLIYQVILYQVINRPKFQLRTGPFFI